MDFVILDKALTALSFITPFMLYGGIIFVLSVNKGVSQLCDKYFHGLISRLEKYSRLKGFLNSFDVIDDKYYTKPTSNFFHRINNHR